MSSQRNPHLVVTVKCAGPGCANIRRESNHWFLITIEPGTFICRPFSSTIDLQESDKPVCGQACAQKLLECFLAQPVSHSPRQQSGHPDQLVSRSASHSLRHQPSQPDQSASQHHINSVIDHPVPEHKMQPHPPNHSQPTPPINEQSADLISNDPMSNQYAVPHFTQPTLASCVYIGLQCSQCGDVRQALNNLPAGETTICPQCGATCYFSRLGTGLTSRELPFHEITSSSKQNVTPFRHTPEIALHPRPWQEA